MERRPTRFPLSEIALVSTRGPRSGLGHFKRARRLRGALLEKTRLINVREVAADEGGFNPRALGDLGLARAVVLDLPPHLWSAELAELINQLRLNSQLVVGIDGPMTNLDLLVLPTFHVNIQHLEQARQAGLRPVWGWEYLMIDQRVGLRSKFKNNQILILTGGSDFKALGQTLPALLEKHMPLQTEINWVVGPFAKSPHIPPSQRLKWRIRRDVDDLRPLLHECGFALTVYGVSLFELLHHGVPSVALSPYGDRDVEHLEILEQEGLAVAATSPSQAVYRLRDLMQDESLAKILSNNGASRIPSSGTTRVAEEILKLL